VAVNNGIGYEEFWHMTLGEIRFQLKTKYDNHIAEFKHQLSLREFQAIRTAEYVSCIFSKDAKVGSYFDKFPSLFEEELEAQEESEMQANIARAKEFAEYHNRKYEQEGGEEDG
jgi:hypothetical protein